MTAPNHTARIAAPASVAVSPAKAPPVAVAAAEAPPVEAPPVEAPPVEAAAEPAQSLPAAVDVQPRVRMRRIKDSKGRITTIRCTWRTGNSKAPPCTDEI
jgi:hypothetical protein